MALNNHKRSIQKRIQASAIEVRGMKVLEIIPQSLNKVKYFLLNNSIIPYQPVNYFTPLIFEKIIFLFYKYSIYKVIIIYHCFIRSTYMARNKYEKCAFQFIICTAFYFNWMQ